MNDRLQKILHTRQCYRDALLSPPGQQVLSDLIRKHIIADPVVRGDSDATMINVGMQRATAQILQKVYGSDKDIHDAIAREHQNHE